MRIYSPKLYIKDLWISVPSGIALLALISALSYLVLSVPRTEVNYFLHSTIVFGVDLIGRYGQLYRPLIVGAVFFLVGTITSFFLYAHDRFLSRLLTFFLGLCALGIAFSVYLVTQLNV